MNINFIYYVTDPVTMEELQLFTKKLEVFQTIEGDNLSILINVNSSLFLFVFYTVLFYLCFAIPTFERSYMILHDFLHLI